MFSTDAVAIRTAAEASPDTMARVIMFAIVTANAPLHAAANASEWLGRVDFSRMAYGDVTTADRSYMGAAMSGAKLAAVQHVWASRESLYRQYRTMDAVSFWNLCIDTVPGLGMVKAAFTVQMLYNELGCIDTHNLRMLGLDRNAVSGKSKRKREQYLQIQSVRSSEQWWNDWCDFVATKYPARYSDGEQVSRLHVEAVGL